jgi:hypothetical protein
VGSHGTQSGRARLSGMRERVQRPDAMTSAMLFDCKIDETQQTIDVNAAGPGERVIMRKRMLGVVRDIDKYELDRYAVKVPIHFDKNTGEFFAEYLEESFRAATVGIVKVRLDRFVRSTIKLHWVPVIQIHLDGGSYSFSDVINGPMHNGPVYQRKHERVEGDLKLKAYRYWLAKRSDGRWMECKIWDSRDFEAEGVKSDNEFLGTSDRRINAHDFYLGNSDKEFALPFAHKESFHEGETFYLPYDENVWQALNAIADRVGELNKQLQALVATEKGRKKLQSFASRMLPAPKIEKVPTVDSK